MQNTNSHVAQALNTLRIVVLALLVTQLVGVAVVLVLPQASEQNPQVSNVFLIILAAMGSTQLVACLIMRRSLVNSARQAYEQSPELETFVPQLLPRMFSLTLVSAALAEGFGLFGLVAYYLSHMWPAIVAPVLALLALIALIPTQAKFSRFVENVTGQIWP